ncbi:putative inactive leucine-rich repeat receptor-like protein kinase [Zea mays]|uniref:Putative inactive leucine-rich repeat receptor-like protein kinase n=1 Tax=Zea mays TaxID=4577 RepID=A0A1D6J5K4_MAIZE|nr:putative inactive leucine-rich repeat receptor-like protein kinase [Zea mays]
MSGNYLFGEVLRGVSRLAGLQTLVLDDNMLGGEVPTWIGAQPSLAVLSLRNNTFQGVVPESLGSAPSLRSLVLASNNLSGNLPDMSQQANLQVLDVGGNSLEPAFPKLGRKVVTVVLARNRFVAFLQNPQLVQEFRPDKQYNIHMLQERYQVLNRLATLHGLDIQKVTM